MDLFFVDATKIEQRVFFLSRDYNLLYSFSNDDKEVTLNGCIPLEDANKRTADSMVSVGGKIYFAPMDSQFIWVFSPEENSFRKVDCGIRGRFTVNNSSIFGKYCFFVGISVPYIVKLDTESGKIEHIIEPYERLKELNSKAYDGRYINRQILRIDNNIILLSGRDNGVLKYNMSDDSFTWDFVGNDCNMYSGIEKRNNEFWMLCNNSKLITKDIDTGRIIEQEITNIDSKSRYAYPVLMDENIWLTTIWGSDSNLCISPEGHIDRTDNNFYLIKTIDTNTFVIQKKDGTVLYKNDKIEKKIPSGVSEEKLEDFFIMESNSCKANFGEPFREIPGFGLKYLINYI